MLVTQAEADQGLVVVVALALQKAIVRLGLDIHQDAVGIPVQPIQHEATQHQVIHAAIRERLAAIIR